MIRTKSVHSSIEPSKDGLRILATRFRGRGLPKSRYDVWMPNLAPSESLLKDFQTEKITWVVFSRQYGRELVKDGESDRQNATIKNHGQKFTLRLLQTLGSRGTVTLLCHCDEDQPHCHRHLLKSKLDGKI
jgi:uncharacterized protein YeaO (DUF488 family)